MAEVMKYEEMKELLGKVPPSDPDMTESIYMDVIKNGFIIYDSKKNKAVCTRCGYEWDLYPREYSGLHGLKDICPCCESENTLLAAGRGRGRYMEMHRVLSFASAEGTLYGFLNAIIVKFEPFGRPDLYRSLQEIYVINKDDQTRWHLKESWRGDLWYEKVNNMNVPAAPSAPYYETKWADHVYTTGLIETVASSDCRYVPLTWRILDKQGMDLPAYIGMMMKYHSVELLAKAGFTNIAQRKINGGGCRAVNWRADSLEKILKLSRGDIRRLRPWNPTCEELETYQKLTDKERRDTDMLVIRDMLAHEEYDYRAHRYRNTYRKKVEKYMPFDKWLKWAKTQEAYKSTKHRPNLLNDYKDYIGMAEKLGVDIHKKSVLRPKDLKQAHDDVMHRLTAERDALIEKAIEENNRTADFRFRDLMIIPAKSQEDLNRESAKLGHCVKTYGDKIARGVCFIFFVRDVKAPEEPYYTLETKPTGEFVQCRGMHNCSMTDEVKMFTDAFVKKLKAEIKKERNTACQTA